MIQGFAKSGDVEVAYTVQGHGDEVVLLLMGLGGRAADWGTEFPALLEDEYRVVRVDNRGVGRSPRVSGGYELAELARDAARVLDAVGAASAHVIGISMGGMVAQLLALEHPDRVEKLVLLSTHFGGPSVEPPHPDALRLFDPGEFVSRGRNPEGMMRHTLSVITAPGFSERAPHVVAAMLENVRAAPTSATAFLAQVQAIVTSDRSERVRGIRQRTLVVHGTSDKLIPPSNGVALANRIPRAELVLMEACGHMPMLEMPRELAETVRAFLRRA